MISVSQAFNLNPIVSKSTVLLDQMLSLGKLKQAIILPSSISIWMTMYEIATDGPICTKLGGIDKRIHFTSELSVPCGNTDAVNGLG